MTIVFPHFIILRYLSVSARLWYRCSVNKNDLRSKNYGLWDTFRDLRNLHIGL